MADLSDEGGHTLAANNLVPPHGCVEGRGKNAGFGSGAWEYLQ
jgi:hypothetical protein